MQWHALIHKLCQEVCVSGREQLRVPSHYLHMKVKGRNSVAEGRKLHGAVHRSGHGKVEGNPAKTRQLGSLVPIKLVEESR